MQVEMGASLIVDTFQNIAIFHFRDYGRKSTRLM